MTASIYSDWRALQEIRKRQGFVGSKAALVARRLRGGSYPNANRAGGRQGSIPKPNSNSTPGDGNPEDEEDEGGGWGELEGALGGLPALLRRVQEILASVDASALDTAAPTPNPDHPPKRSAAQAGSGVGGRGGREGQGGPRGPKSEAESRFARALEVADAACADLLRCGGLSPEYVLRITDTASVSPLAQVDAAEAARRRALEALQFRASIRINGAPVTHTTAAHVSFPSLTVDFRQHFEFHLLTQPDAVSVDIVAVGAVGGWGGVAGGLGTGGGDKSVASVSIPLPGFQGAASASAPGAVSGGMQGQDRVIAGALAPAVGWLAFSDDPHGAAGGLSKGRTTGKARPIWLGLGLGVGLGLG